jgi:hypothetical protein
VVRQSGNDGVHLSGEQPRLKTSRWKVGGRPGDYTHNPREYLGARRLHCQARQIHL